MQKMRVELRMGFGLGGRRTERVSSLRGYP